MKDLRGTTAIVTGASRGIGVHIATALADEGVNLSLAARSEAELEAVRADVAALGVEAIASKCDVTNAYDRARLIERTEAELGPIDVLVNNAGIETAARFEESTVDDLTQNSPVGFSVVCPGLVTETGMYARWEARGAKAPRAVGRSSPDKVAQVVVTCIQRNRGEVMVNTAPVRPLLSCSASPRRSRRG